METTTTSVEFDLDALVERHQKGLWRYLRVLGCEPELAEDLVQEAFLSAHRARPALHDDRSWGAWLRVVARNRFITERRRHNRAVNFAAFRATELAFEQHAQDGGDEYLDALALCVEGLETRSRELVKGRYHAGLGVRAIAERHGLTESNTSVMLHRALQRLRTCVERRMRHA